MAKRKRRAKGEGTIYERADGTWCGQLNVGRDRVLGRPIRETVYGATRGEVVEKMDELRAKRSGGSPVTAPSNPWTVRAFGEHWLLMMKHKVAPKSHDRYRLDLTHLNLALGSHLLGELTGWDVARGYDTLSALGYSPSEQRQAGTRLRQMLKKAIELGAVRENIAMLIPLPKVERREIHPFSEAEVTQLLAAASGGRLEALYRLAIDAGARLGELLALEWADWSQERREMRFIKTLEERGQGLRVKESKTKASRRTVRVSESTAIALYLHRELMAAEGHGSTHVFCTPLGGHLWTQHIYRHWKPLLGRAGFPPAAYRFHDLRHTCATLLLGAGENIRAIAARLGHSTPEITLRTYTHFVPSMHANAASIMDRLL